MVGTSPSVKKPAIGIWLCLPALLRISLAMRWLRLFALLFLPLFTLLLPSCVSNSTGSNPGKHPSGIGPFDRNGNYVEAWADTPSQWGRKSSFSMASNSAADTDTPSVASNEEPPADAVPLPLSGSSTQTVVKTTAPVRKSGEVEVASLSRPKPKVTRNDDDDRPKSTVKKTTTTKGKQVVAKNSKSKPTAKELAAAKAKAKSKATASASAKTKSKATASTTTKKKPAARYTVKKGDNLVKIADRYNTTAAAIRKANGLKSAVVSPGKTLVIPKG
jgi:LysM repeat protein